MEKVALTKTQAGALEIIKIRSNNIEDYIHNVQTKEGQKIPLDSAIKYFYGAYEIVETIDEKLITIYHRFNPDIIPEGSNIPGEDAQRIFASGVRAALDILEIKIKGINEK